MPCRTAKSRAPGFLAAVLALLATNVARADEVEPAIKELIKIDQGVHIMSLEFTGARRESESLADRAVIDAQELLARGRTDEATTILLDVITGWPRTRAAHDATFLLGDALFQLRDFLSARTLYEQAIASWSGTRREQRAVGRLIELALRTGDFEPVDRYLRLLATVPALSLEPSAAYVKAKLAYHRGNLGEAARLFAAIAPTSAFGWQARYFIGTIKVRAGDLNGAAAAFGAVVQAKAPDDDAREIQDLARLALGRICYQQERMDCARVHYLASIQRQPQPNVGLVADALYELGFTYIRSGDLDHARDAFERLVLVDPTGARVFEGKLLLGSLQLHRGDLDSARGSFSSARDVLGPSYDLLAETMARIEADPAFLDSLVNQGLEEIALSTFVSPAIRNWARTDPEVERLLTLSADVAGTRRGVADVKQSLRRIEGVLANPDRQTLYPDLTRSRTALTEVSKKLNAVRGPFANRAGNLKTTHLVASAAPRTNRNAPEWDGNLEVLSRVDATALQVLALDERIDAEGNLRLAATRDFVAVRRQEVTAADNKLTVVVSEARNLGGDLVRALCARLAGRLYDLVVRADVGLVDVAWAVTKRSSGAVHAVMAAKNRELETLDADRKQQEVALTRRFLAEGAWALEVESRLLPLPALEPLPPLPPLSSLADH